MIRLPAVDPRNYQLAFYRAMDRGCNRAVKSWHRRAGKDISDFQYMVRMAMKRVGTYYYYFPTLELAKKALWDNIVEFYSHGKVIAAGNMIDILCPSDIRRRRNNSDYFLELCNGSVIKIGGTDNLSVIGMNGYGYVFSEWQSQKKEAFGYISPILRENGGWALFNGTMRGKKNHLYTDIHTNAGREGWFSQWLKPEDTKEYYWINEEEGIVVNPELAGAIHPHTLRPFTNIQKLVDAAEISMSLALQEYLNRADSDVYGGYYGWELKKLSKDGRKRPIDPFSDVVYTFWDLGGAGEKTDKTAIVFAHVNTVTKEYRVVDYYENRGKLRGHYWDVVNSKRYSYGGHFYPHDGKKANVWTGETSGETAEREFGAEIRYVPKTQNTMNDIEVVRRGMARTSFASENAGVGVLLDALGHYHENEGTGAPCHKESCRECNGASHGADAFRYMHMAIHLGLVEPYLLKNTTSRNWWEKKPTESDIYDVFYT